MRVKLEPETAFIGKKFAYIFFAIILTLNLAALIWFFCFRIAIKVLQLNLSFNTYIKIFIEEPQKS